MNSKTLNQYLEIKKKISPIENDISEYASRIFREKFPVKSPNENVWYEGFEIIDEHTIEVKYGYGGGDQTMNSSFKHKI